MPRAGWLKPVSERRLADLVSVGVLTRTFPPGLVDAVRAKELAILRTSVLQGCRYCVHAHTVVALDVGLSRDEIRGLRGDVVLEDAFPQVAERALIGWIDALAGATGPIPDDVWVVAREHWPEHALVELTVTVGATMFLNRLATGLDLPTSDQVAERLSQAGLA